MDWEVYLAAAPDDFTYAGKLYDALRGHARVFWEGEDVDAGADTQATCARAFSSSFVSVFVLSRSTARNHEVRANVASAIGRLKTEALTCVVPVYVDDDAARDTVYGTRIFKTAGAEVVSGDPQADAEAILRVVSRLRAQRKASPTVAVVAVADELSLAQQAAAQRLRKLPMVREVTLFDAARLESFDEASKRDFRLVLVGIAPAARMY